MTAAARVLVALALLLAPLAAPVAGASGQDDCGTGADAGGTSAAAAPLAFPVSNCEGALGGGDDRDWYRLDLVAGDALRVAFYTPTSGALVLACVHSPSSSPRICAHVGDDVVEFPIGETGPWRFMVETSAWLGFEYALSLSVDVEARPGSVAQGHPQLPVFRTLAALDPGRYDGFDGVWFDLTAVPDGRHSLELTQADAGGTDLDAWFYDASGTLLASQPCSIRDAGVTEFCTIPLGAARILVEASRLGQTAFEVRHWR